MGEAKSPGWSQWLPHSQPPAPGPQHSPRKPGSALSQRRGLRWRNGCSFYLGQAGLLKICTRQLLINSRKRPNALANTQGGEGTSTG